MHVVPPVTTTSSVLSFSDIESDLRATFFQPDTQACRIILAVVASHFLVPHGYPPTWVVLIGPSGSGKTSTALLIPNAKHIGEITPKTFLSAYKANGKNNSLLSIWGDKPLVVIKDFTTLMSMRYENKSEISAQLREIHDGEFVKNTGMGGTVAWRGRMTIIACSTPAIDRERLTSRIMGDRFVELRWSGPPSEALAGRIVHSPSRLDDTLLRTAIQKYLFNCAKECPKLTPKQETNLASLASIVALLRTPIVRDDKGFKIVDVGTPESPTRIAQAITSITLSSAALDHQEYARDEDLALAVRISIDCVPPARLLCLLNITDEGTPAVDLAGLPMNRWARGRAIDDLDALGLIEVRPSEVCDKVLWLTNRAESLNLSLFRQLSPLGSIHL
jgi:hypothetical protein